MLRADAEYYDDALALAKRRLEESGLHDEIRQMQKQEREHYDQVYEYEFSYLKFKRELMRLSPRAIKMNFTEDIEMSIEEYRDKITKEKLDTLFRYVVVLWLPQAMGQNSTQSSTRQHTQVVWSLKCLDHCIAPQMLSRNAAGGGSSCAQGTGNCRAGANEGVLRGKLPAISN